MLNPQSFGQIKVGNTNKVPCEGPRIIHVPIAFEAPALLAGSIVYSDVIDLTSFLQGNPAPFVSCIQGVAGAQRAHGTNDAYGNNFFSSELIFETGFKTYIPGRGYTAVSVFASNLPKVQINIFTMQDLAAPETVLLDLYFTNFPVDDLQYYLDFV